MKQRKARKRILVPGREKVTVSGPTALTHTSKKPMNTSDALSQDTVDTNTRIVNRQGVVLSPELLGEFAKDVRPFAWQRRPRRVTLSVPVQPGLFDKEK